MYQVIYIKVYRFYKIDMRCFIFCLGIFNEVFSWIFVIKLDQRVCYVYE